MHLEKQAYLYEEDSTCIYTGLNMLCQHGFSYSQYWHQWLKNWLDVPLPWISKQIDSRVVFFCAHSGLTVESDGMMNWKKNDTLYRLFSALQWFFLAKKVWGW